MAQNLLTYIMKELLMNNFYTLWRAFLYFFIAALPVLIEQTSEFLKADKWPTGPRFFFAMICAISSGLIALRAYYDSSVLRNQQEKKNETILNSPNPGV